MKRPVTFELQFPVTQIRDLAALYKIDDLEEQVVDVIAPVVRERGYFMLDEFLTVTRWKTPARTKKLLKRNVEDDVQAVTALALSTPTERLRIESLELLPGVARPTASALLHLGHHEPYPILDFRALWSLSVDANKVIYNFAFWWDYVQVCRKLAAEAGVTMRVLDRALWQYSKSREDHFTWQPGDIVVTPGKWSVAFKVGQSQVLVQDLAGLTTHLVQSAPDRDPGELLHEYVTRLDAETVRNMPDGLRDELLDRGHTLP